MIRPMYNYLWVLTIDDEDDHIYANLKQYLNIQLHKMDLRFKEKGYQKPLKSLVGKINPNF